MPKRVPQNLAKRLDVFLLPAPYRALASRALLPLWPRAELPAGRIEIVAEERLPVSTDMPGDTREEDVLRLTRIDGPFDIDPLSADLFDRGRLVRRAPPAELLPTAPARPDLTRRLRAKPVVREPVVILHDGGDNSFATFCADILPRFFALDHFGLPADLLAIVPVSMGMTDHFQDAITDGIFRPRPVELMRQGRFTRSDTVYRADRALSHPGILQRIRRKFERIYSVDAQSAEHEQGCTLFLCDGGEARAGRTIRDWPAVRSALAAKGIAIIDPSALSLRDLALRLRQAETLVAPDTGELSACVLAGDRLRRLVELQTVGSGDLRPRLLAAGLGIERKAGIDSL